MGFFDELFGTKKDFYWGTTRVELKCIWAQYVGTDVAAQDLKGKSKEYCMGMEGATKIAAGNLIPNIDKIWPKDIRISYAQSFDTALGNAEKMLKEPLFSETKLIFFPLILTVQAADQINKISIGFALFVDGPADNLVSIIDDPSQWGQFQVR